MLKIGLTGGIGCGKTTVSHLFASYGIPILDADIIARELTAPGQPALPLIAQAFGEDILEQSQLNRSKLRERIFHRAENRQKLEGILHPLIYACMEERLAQLQAPYCILAIPLLLETQRQAMVDRVLVIDCPPEMQRRNVKQRDGIDDATFELIVQAQLKREERLAAADDIIENADVVGRLKQQVAWLHAAYLKRAGTALEDASRS